MSQSRTKTAERAGRVGILCNLLLFGFKLAVGILAASVSVTADAFNNLTDAGSSVVSLIGSKMAGKAADEAHPFGHGRIEYISAFIVAFLVIQVGFSAFTDALVKIIHPQEMKFSWLSMAVLAVSVGVKLWMSVFYRRVAKRIGSSVFEAASADSLGDVLVTGAAAAALLAYGLLDLNIDGIVGLAVSGIVMYNGFVIAKETLEPLIGEPIDPAICRKLTNFVRSYDGIVGTHDLIVHNYGPGQYMASIHAEVPRERDIEASHETVDRIEKEARQELGIVLVIHMDPVDLRDETTQKYRELVGRTLEQIDPDLKFHDFRMIHGEDNSNLVFDLVTPWRYSEAEENRIMLEICARVKQANPHLSCVITLDRPFAREEKGKHVSG